MKTTFDSINKSEGVSIDYLPIGDNYVIGDEESYGNGEQSALSNEESAVIGNNQKKKIDEETQRGTLFSSIVNLMNSCIGGGILAYPYSFLSTGLISGIALGFFLGILASCTLYIICLAGNSGRKEGKNLRSIQDIIGFHLGPFWKKVCEIVLAVYMTGAIVGYMCIVGDSMEPIVSLIFPEYFFLNHRKIIIPFFCTLFIFPVTLLRDVTKLQGPSAVANIGIFITAGLIVVSSIVGMARNGSRVTSDILVLNTETFFHAIPTFMLAAPVIALSYQCHVIIGPIRHELKNPTPFRLAIVVVCSMTLTILIYLTIGIFGLLRFGRQTEPDILMSYTGNNVIAIIGRILVGITILFTYPVCFYTDRLCIISLLFDYPYFDNSLWIQSKNPGETKRLKTLPFITITIVLFTFTLCLADIVPDIVVVFGLVGSFGPIFLDYIFPSMLLAQLILKNKNIGCFKKTLYMIVPTLILVFAITTMVTGLTSNIIRSFVNVRV